MGFVRLSVGLWADWALTARTFSPSHPCARRDVRFAQRAPPTENTIGLETNGLHPLISNEIIVVTDADFLPLFVRELLAGGFRCDGLEIALTRRARREQN